MNSVTMSAPSPTRRNGTILPMDSGSIQRIAAGQAITDLASCVKELLDNALDAVRLFNQGLDIVEVTDDGCGVPAQSRPYMAMKNATSKIQSFDDIYSTSTLGFRGEALFCLANISRTLVVATRTAAEPMGQKLQFRADGSLLMDSIAPVPRKVGTTVAVVKLFDSLPVRRADLVKRIHAQRQKVFSVVQGYAILCLGVRFNLMDIVGDGGEQVKLRTAAGTTCVEQTVSSVLGSRFLSGLSRISFNLNAAGTARVEGLLSTASSREARELQFFSINGRPVDLPKVSRVLGEAWRTLEGGNLHNNKKRPACVLQFTLPPNSFDVNLSPDKRQVLLINEESFCQIVQGAVTQFWSNQLDGKFTVQNGTDSVSAAETVVPSEFVPKARRRMAFVHDFRTARLQHEGGDAHLQGQKINHTTHESQAPRTTETKTRRSSPEKERLSTDSEKRQWAQVQQRFQTKGSTQQEEIQALETADPKASTASSSSAPTRTTASTAVVSDDSTSTSSQTSSKKSLTLEDFAFTPISQEPKTPPGPTLDRYSRRRRLQKRSEPAEQEASKGANKRSHEAAETDTSDMESPEKRARALMRTACENESNQQEEPPPPAQDEASQEIEKKTIVWKSFQGTGAVMQAARDARLDLQDRRKRLKSMQNERNHGEGGTGVKTVNGDNQSKVVSLTKKDFKEMEIIGQFNLGFILARCKNNHLWILDQHACDEKYNFERLCATTIIHEQKLIAPMPLELSPSEEDCVLENMEIFEANGFRFAHDDTKPPRHRLALTALPHSGARDGRKAVQFGKDDVSALCAILGADGASYPQSGGTGVDGTGQYANNAVRRYAGSLSQNGQKVIARLPKAIAMFANRACRGSIMIGKALSQKEMEGIVERLGQVEHPWNCPHGRPTMRHVRDMLPVLADDGKRAEQHIAGPTVTVVPATQREEQEDE